MDQKSDKVKRNRAILIVRIATFGGVASALGLSWLFSNMAEAYFSGKPPTAKPPAPPPNVPVAAAPVQQPPTVITSVVHHPSQGRAAPPAPAGAAPRPPAQGPAPAPPAPPPPPVCHSTPSKPC